MEPVSEALQLLQRQAELEAAMRAPGGIPITEERELYGLRARLSRYPHAVRAVLEAARSLNRKVAELTVRDVERWLGAECS
jgi:hypothetical protein